MHCTDIISNKLKLRRDLFTILCAEIIFHCRSHKEGNPATSSSAEDPENSSSLPVKDHDDITEPQIQKNSAEITEESRFQCTTIEIPILRKILYHKRLKRNV